MYGLELRKGKCKCPFHSEKTASLVISQSKQIWHCFGCGKGGDCISLVAELLKVNNYEAAVSINNKFGLGLTNQTSNFEINQYEEKQKAIKKFKEWELNSFQILCDYKHLLEHHIEDWNDPFFQEAMFNIEKVNYFIEEIFIYGTQDDKIWFWKNQRKVLEKYGERIRVIREVT